MRRLPDNRESFRSLVRASRGGLLTSALGTLAVRGGSALLVFVSTVILARQLGASGYGTYAWAFAWASVLQIITSFGFDILAIREFAAYKERDKWPAAVHGLFRTAPKVVLLGSTVVTLLVLSASTILIEPTQRATFIIAVAFVPLLALTAVRQGAVQGLGSVVAARLPDDLVRPLVFNIFLLIGWSVLSLRHSPPVAMALQGVAASVAFIFGLVVLRRALPSRGGLPHVQSQTRAWLRLAIPLGLLNGIAILLAQVDLILLGFLSDSTQVGLYSTSTRVASFVGIAEFAVNAAYLPVVARLFAANRMDRLKTGAPMVTLGAVLLSAVLAVPLIIFAPQVLRLFGSSFESGVFVLRVLCVTFVISAVAGQNGALLTMTKHPRPMIVGSGVALATNVGLNLIFIPLQAARGAAIAWLLSVIVWNGFLSLQVRRVHGFTATPLALLPMLRQRIRNARRPDSDV